VQAPAGHVGEGDQVLTPNDRRVASPATSSSATTSTPRTSAPTTARRAEPDDPVKQTAQPRRIEIGHDKHKQAAAGTSPGDRRDTEASNDPPRPPAARRDRLTQLTPHSAGDPGTSSRGARTSGTRSVSSFPATASDDEQGDMAGLIAGSGGFGLADIQETRRASQARVAVVPPARLGVTRSDEPCGRRRRPPPAAEADSSGRQDAPSPGQPEGVLEVNLDATRSTHPHPFS